MEDIKLKIEKIKALKKEYYKKGNQKFNEGDLNSYRENSSGYYALVEVLKILELNEEQEINEFNYLENLGKTFN